ncbi:hypothetical protein BT69DRAFT_898659 [Atractiella rhizophila]|nr:hypothetical protein BT69DRAFT_898659 [Atractiella rhizophila]
MITSTIEIASPPEKVRSVFLDFPKMQEWHKGFIASIVVQGAEKGTGHDVKVGDKLDSSLGGISVVQVVEENSPTQFKTRGVWHGVLTGIHGYRFEPSSTNPGGTTFTQWEEFEGLLSFVMAPSLGGKTTLKHFEGFNADLKRHVEGMQEH